MSWETAIVISVLGVSFFLIYLASTIESSNRLSSALKLFLTIISMLGILINSSLNLHLLEANNSSMTSSVYNALASNLTTNMKYIIWTFIIVMFFFMIYFVIDVFKLLNNSVRRE
jgi:flagellar biosynthesis protein FlhB